MKIRLNKMQILVLAMGWLVPGVLWAEKIELRFISWDSLKNEVVSYKDGADYHAISVRDFARSLPYVYHGTDQNGIFPIDFFTDGQDANGKPVKIKVAHADVPKENKNPLLMFFEKTKPQDTHPEYDVLVLDDSVERLPFGSYCLFNFTPGVMTGQIETKKFQLQSNDSEIIQLSDNTRRNIAVKFFTADTEPPRLWKETYWRHEPKKRFLVFIAKNSSSDPNMPDYMVKVVEEAFHTPPPSPPSL